MNSRIADVLVVGAGFAGSVAARRLADAGFKVRIIDRRPHVGGNAWDEMDKHGVLIHPYGPHIFHTNNRDVFAWLSKFTQWRFYEHRVLARIGDKYFPIPINRTTLNLVFGLSLNESEVPEYLESIREHRTPAQNSEDVILNSVGRKLCDLFFSGYTRKQWGCDLSDLAPDVAARIPVRTNDDDRYFTDMYQFMPTEGYGKMFAKILDHPGIEVGLNLDYKLEPLRNKVKHTIYTGPVDEFLEYRFGALPYRSLHFDHYYVASVEGNGLLQPAPVVNYPNEEIFTRITEFKQLTGQHHPGSSLVREYPRSTGDPYYPIPCNENMQLYKKYADAVAEFPDFSFVGRLAQYKYYNMDQVVDEAIKLADDLICRLNG